MKHDALQQAHEAALTQIIAWTDSDPLRTPGDAAARAYVRGVLEHHGILAPRDSSATPQPPHEGDPTARLKSVAIWSPQTAGRYGMRVWVTVKSLPDSPQGEVIQVWRGTEYLGEAFSFPFGYARGEVLEGYAKDFPTKSRGWRWRDEPLARPARDLSALIRARLLAREAVLGVAE